MALFLLVILLVMIFAPFVFPWGKKLLTYCTAVWFFLWLMLFFQAERENNPTYDAGLFGDSGFLGFFILVFAIVVSVRSLVHVVMSKVKASRNHT